MIVHSTAARGPASTSEIGGQSVDEHSDGMRKAQPLEAPALFLARATRRTRRQAKGTFVVGTRRRIPLGRSASIANGSLGACSGTRTVTGRNAGGAAALGRSARSMSQSRRFQF